MEQSSVSIGPQRLDNRGIPQLRVQVLWLATSPHWPGFLTHTVSGVKATLPSHEWVAM